MRVSEVLAGVWRGPAIQVVMSPRLTLILISPPTTHTNYRHHHRISAVSTFRFRDSSSLSLIENWSQEKNLSNTIMMT